MLALEAAPHRYERGMMILTLGRLARVRECVLRAVRPGQRVLDIGCGTGVLTAAMAEAGAHVIGIDTSPAILEIARQVASQSRAVDRIQLRETSVMELDHAFPAGAFDLIVSVLTFSELLSPEVDFALAHCRRLLAPGGRLLVADEVWPASASGRALLWLARLPFVCAAYLATGTTSRPIRGLRERLDQAGFKVEETHRFLAGTLVVRIASPRWQPEEAECA